jgi:predicted transcriptional regulator
MVLLKAYIPEGLKARVDACAAEEQRTIKAVVVRALERYLAEAEERGDEAA